MGLDVYVGSLTGWYAAGPPAAVERLAWHQRVPYMVIRGSEHASGHTERDVIRSAVLAWRDALRQALGDRVEAPLDWDESPEAPSFTGRPGWDGYGATVLLAAYEEHPELEAPATVAPEWPDDVAYQTSVAAGACSRYDHLLVPDLWLPCPFRFTFRTQDAAGHTVDVGSSTTLLAQLRTLGARTGLATPDTGGEVPRPAGPKPPLRATARHGLAALLRLAGRSVEHRVPMRLDH
ncbi:MAG TPA: hypothetical protein VEP73_01300 [Actinomycetota bacterium]|nr:hypothetical protein [Actinomycetota bacterium]